MKLHHALYYKYFCDKIRERSYRFETIYIQTFASGNSVL